MNDKISITLDWKEKLYVECALQDRIDSIEKMWESMPDDIRTCFTEKEVLETVVHKLETQWREQVNA